MTSSIPDNPLRSQDIPPGDIELSPMTQGSIPSDATQPLSTTPNPNLYTEKFKVKEENIDHVHDKFIEKLKFRQDLKGFALFLLLPVLVLAIVGAVYRPAKLDVDGKVIGREPFGACNYTMFGLAGGAFLASLGCAAKSRSYRKEAKKMHKDAQELLEKGHLTDPQRKQLTEEVEKMKTKIRESSSLCGSLFLISGDEVNIR